MITQGNDKLGPLVWGWSIPAKKTCPGASPHCLSVCYGLAGRFHMATVKEAHRRNYKLTKSPQFSDWMTGMIRDFCVSTLRIHVVGDFYDPEYLAKWHHVVAANRRVKFYAYTRSWTEAELFSPLQALAAEKNMRLWFSFDATMPAPPKLTGIRRCYLSANDDDLPQPGKAELIFRENKSTVLKRGNSGELCCPYDNGITKTTCSHCKICWDTKAAPKKKVQLTHG
jgi:hypothetical protein